MIGFLFDTSPVDRAFRDIERALEFTTWDVLSLAQLAAQRITERTRVGRDFRDRQFIPYTEAYARRKGVSVGAVDLELTGRMLDQVQGRAAGDVAIVEVVGDRVQIAMVHNSLSSRKTRRWLDAAPGSSVHNELTDEAVDILRGKLP